MKGSDMSPRAILIAGPTASGKSSLALGLAKKLNGIIINADALQVYDNWRVLTARPSDAEMSQAPHKLYGHIGKTQEYSVGHWIAEITATIAETDCLPIITGGTGLYFGALTHGLSAIPATPNAIRTEGNRIRLDAGADWFRHHLAEFDPETLQTLDQQNPARLQRAWEVLEATGHGLSYWHARPTRPLIALEETMPILLNWNVNDLNGRIDSRFDQMMKNGAVEECETARRAGFDPDLPSNRAIGAREIIDAFDGNIAMQDAVIKAKILTHQFAKRQRTWFRSKMKNWLQLDMSTKLDLAAFADEIVTSFG